MQAKRSKATRLLYVDNELSWMVMGLKASTESEFLESEYEVVNRRWQETRRMWQVDLV